jgi:hypothetical protein
MGYCPLAATAFRCQTSEQEIGKKRKKKHGRQACSKQLASDMGKR